MTTCFKGQTKIGNNTNSPVLPTSYQSGNLSSCRINTCLFLFALATLTYLLQVEVESRNLPDIKSNIPRRVNKQNDLSFSRRITKRHKTVQCESVVENESDYDTTTDIESTRGGSQKIVKKNWYHRFTSTRQNQDDNEEEEQKNTNNDDATPFNECNELIDTLGAKFPESTMAERIRFAGQYKEKAFLFLGSYLQWRRTCDTFREQQQQQQQQQQQKKGSRIGNSRFGQNILGTGKEQTNDKKLSYRVDKDDWDTAVRIARKLGENKKNSKHYDESVYVPQCIFSYFTKDNKIWKDNYGRNVIVFLPGLIDDTIMSFDTYTKAIVIYLDSKVSRETLECGTIVVDTCFGVGWKNIPGAKMLLHSFIQDLVYNMDSLFPQRNGLTIIYPVPNAIRWTVSNIVSKFIKPDTAKKIMLLSGGTMYQQPKELKEHFYKDFLSIMQQHRIDTYS